MHCRMFGDSSEGTMYGGFLDCSDGHAGLWLRFDYVACVDKVAYNSNLLLLILLLIA
jgi:hypothetical protein